MLRPLFGVVVRFQHACTNLLVLVSTFTRVGPVLTIEFHFPMVIFRG